MRRNRIQVNSGTYCIAPAQFDRRMMSQIAFTAELTDCCVASLLPLPLPLADPFLGGFFFAIVVGSE